MPTLIQMPKLGLTMTEGTITEWVAETGKKVAAGDVIMIIETDKVEVEVEAVIGGVVVHSSSVGETLEPGKGVGWLLAEGEAVPEGSVPDLQPSIDKAVTPVAVASPGNSKTSDDVAWKTLSSPGAGGRVLASPNAKRVAAEMQVDLSALVGTGPGGRITSEDVLAGSNSVLNEGASKAVDQSAESFSLPTSWSDRFVPFAAAKAAERLGVDLRSVPGSGPDGRVSRRDVYEYARSERRPYQQTQAVVSQSPSPGDVIPMKGMRGVIAERMHSSLQEMAQLTLTMDVDMGNIVGLREQLKEIGPQDIGRVPGYTDFVITAVAQALKLHPKVNAQVVGDSISVLEEVNVGMAVAVSDGLVVPVIKGAELMGLMDVAVETHRLTTAARDKKLSLDDLSGGTFSVTTLGMFGVDMFTPVINPPNAGILGVGRIRDDVAWEGYNPVKVQRMTLSLTWDHRVFDGAPAAEFTATVKRLLEQPLRLLG